jgi:cobalt ECF transporter T component CbiQ
METQPRRRRKNRRSIIEGSLQGISETLERSFFADEISKRPGLLQSLDPRVKLVSIIMMILATSLIHNLLMLVILYLGVILLAWLSKIPLWFFIRRVWLFLPFFTGVIALPALFLTPGPILFSFPVGLDVTYTGVTTALFLLFRVSASVSLASLLVLTTPWNGVLNALSVLRVPDVITLILGMTYRYIYLLLHTANDMFMSRKSRVVGRLNSAEQRRVIAATSGELFNKTLDLSGEVYLAMQSRGFRGTVRTLKPARMQPRDWAWGALLTAVTILIVYLGVLL